MKNMRVLVWLAAVLIAAGCAKKKQNADSGATADTTQNATAAPADSAERGPWRWIATVTPTERIVCNNPDMYTLTFLPDSTVRVLIDCNRGSGRYQVDGKSIRIGPVATTRMMCPPGSMDATFGKQIDAARGWFLEADTLMLDLMADSGTMRFVR